MAFVGAQLALTAGVRAALNATDSDNIPGQSVAILSTDDGTGAEVDLYLGGPTVTTGNGAKLPAGTPFSTSVDPRGEVLYAVCPVDATVFLLHQGA